MNHPNDYNDREYQTPEESAAAQNAAEEPFAAEASAHGQQSCGEMSPVEMGALYAPRDPAAPAPQWYGVSYQHQGTQLRHPPKPRKRGRGITVAICVIVFVLLAAIAGYAGAMLYSSANDILPMSGDLGGNDIKVPSNSASDSNGNGLGEDVFGAEGNEDYGYEQIVLNKNNGSGLAGSVNGSAGNNVKSKIEVVASVKDSVVEISTTAVSNYGAVTAGAGSGVIIHADGIIVTNNHVIEDAERIYVRLTNGNTYEATVRGTDEDGDIAIIKIAPKETLTVAKLGCSSALVEGEEVIAIGNPLGELGGTVTDGIISRVERELRVDGVTMTLLQTNAAINSGNSGGGLFNMAGELIGVVNAKYSASGVEGLGFAIPIDTAVISIEHLLKLGYIPNIPSLGVELAEGTVRNGFTYRQVVYVYDQGDSDVFGYQDIFVSIAGVSVSSLSEVKQVVNSYKVGDTITVVVLRNNQEVTLQVTLVEYVPNVD